MHSRCTTSDEANQMYSTTDAAQQMQHSRCSTSADAAQQIYVTSKNLFNNNKSFLLWSKSRE